MESIEWIFVPVTPAEFETERLRAALDNTDHVRPFMACMGERKPPDCSHFIWPFFLPFSPTFIHAAGDHRDAEALLSDATNDWSRLRIENLVKCPQGREILDKFAGRTRLDLCCLPYLNTKSGVGRGSLGWALVVGVMFHFVDIARQKMAPNC
jgi:hypothetical protein